MIARNAVIRSSGSVDQPGATVHDHRPVVHRHVEGRPGEHDPVDDRHRDADRVAGLQGPHHPARGRPVHVERVADPGVRHRDHHRCPVVRRCRRGPRARRRGRLRPSRRRRRPVPRAGGRCCEGWDPSGQSRRAKLRFRCKARLCRYRKQCGTGPRPARGPATDDRRQPGGTGGSPAVTRTRVDPGIAPSPPGRVGSSADRHRRRRRDHRARRRDLRRGGTAGRRPAGAGDGSVRLGPRVGDQPDELDESPGRCPTRARPERAGRRPRAVCPCRPPAAPASGAGVTAAAASTAPAPGRRGPGAGRRPRRPALRPRRRRRRVAAPPPPVTTPPPTAAPPPPPPPPPPRRRSRVGADARGRRADVVRHRVPVHGQHRAPARSSVGRRSCPSSRGVAWPSSKPAGRDSSPTSELCRHQRSRRCAGDGVPRHVDVVALAVGSWQADGRPVRPDGASTRSSGRATTATSTRSTTSDAPLGCGSRRFGRVRRHRAAPAAPGGPAPAGRPDRPRRDRQGPGRGRASPPSCWRPVPTACASTSAATSGSAACRRYHRAGRSTSIRHCAAGAARSASATARWPRARACAGRGRATACHAASPRRPATRTPGLDRPRRGHRPRAQRRPRGGAGQGGVRRRPGGRTRAPGGRTESPACSSTTTGGSRISPGWRRSSDDPGALVVHGAGHRARRLGPRDRGGRLGAAAVAPLGRRARARPGCWTSTGSSAGSRVAVRRRARRRVGLRLVRRLRLGRPARAVRVVVAPRRRRLGHRRGVPAGRRRGHAHC